jgi:hypothetical protein
MNPMRPIRNPMPLPMAIRVTNDGLPNNIASLL